MTCNSCGQIVPAGSRFCPHCGHGLVSARAEERRVVTVLFADLVGFTAMSETLDPEQVKLLVDGCFQRLVADVTTFGGRVDKIVGDAIVALFGAPVAHEDDAERAVRAALRMQATLATHVEQLPVDIRMRIGVNTGEVLVGALRAGGDYTAMGDVVNTASRLQTVAPPGGVLVGPATHSATDQVIRYEPLGSVQARGREEPVATWLALEAVAPPGRRPRRARAPLVGRDTETVLLLDGVRLASRYHRAFLAVVEGEAGVGKNRLVESVCTEAASSLGALVLEGRCAPYGEANPWWPVAVALDTVVCLDPDSPLEQAEARTTAVVAEALALPATDPRVLSTVEGLLQLTGRPTRLDDIEPARAREEVSRSVLTLLEALARRGLVVLAVADLQWADPHVLALLERVLNQLGGLPLAMVTTQRPDRAGVWPPMPGRHTALLLRLDPLDRDSADQLARLLLGDVSDDVRAGLIERSGGNPFFLEELASLVEEGEAGAELPDTLRGLVAARLDALQPSERAMLDNAAVLGSWGAWVPLEQFGIALGQHPDRATLRSLADQELLDVDGEMWSFRSESVREVAYAMLTKVARAQRHAGVAEALLSKMGERPERAEQIAFHFAAAAELVQEIGTVDKVPGTVPAQAVTWLLHAAEWSADQDVLSAAERLATRALSILDGDHRTAPDDPLRVRALLIRASSYAEQRDVDKARADVSKALEGARLAGDAAMLAKARSVLGQVERTAGRFDSSTRELSHALVLARQAGDELTRAGALRELGMTAIFAGDFDAAERNLAEADEVFLALGDRRGHAWVDQNMAWISFVRGDSHEAESRLRDAADTFLEMGDRGGLAWVNGLLAFVRFQQGRRDEAAALGRLVSEEANERGDRWAAAMMESLLAGLELWAGNIDEALELATAARGRFRAIGERYGEVQSIGPLSRALVAKGRVSEANRITEECQRAAGPFGLESFAAMISAGAAVHAGDGDRAVRFARVALEEMDDQVGYDVDARVALGLGLLQIRRVDEALGELQRSLLDHPGRPYPAAALALGLAAAGRPDEAVALAAGVPVSAAATYLDQVLAWCVTALAEAQRDDQARVDEAVTSATALADASSDVVARALARMAAAVAYGVLGDPRETSARADAEARASRLEGRLSGWWAAFALASGVPSTAASYVGSTAESS
jgi:class 3 adenylate cyclase/predicted ATPase